MNIFKNTKHFFARTIVLLLVMIWVGCDNGDNEVVYSENQAINQQVLDPYIQVATPFFPFAAGSKYGIQVNVINGVNRVNKLNVYATYTDAATKITESEILLKTYDVTGNFRTLVLDSLTYQELKAAGPLPENDADLSPGSGWSFRFEGVSPDGETVPFAGGMNIVLSKYAGIYRVTNSVYMRIQVDPAVFPGEGVARYDGSEVFIGFVDENTLSYNDAWGYFPTPGCSWAFDYDEDGKITDIVLSDGIVCASATATLASCETPAKFKNLSTFVGVDDLCSVSNVIIDNEATGEHVIKLTYGYDGAGGTRQFTETLTKVVD
jgi:YD repeat-containing protein